MTKDFKEGIFDVYQVHVYRFMTLEFFTGINFSTLLQTAQHIL